MTISTPKNIIYFDFTGTLFDPFLNIRSILNAVSADMGFKHFDDSELDEIPKMPPIALLNAFSVPDLEKKNVVKEVLARLEEEIHTIAPVPGIRELLYALHEQHCYLGILSSNTHANIMKWLSINKLDIFNDVICIPFQANKTPYLQMVKNKFPNHSHFIFVSDELKDLGQANEAGFFSIGVSWGFDTADSLQQAHPKAILTNPADLISILPNIVQANKQEMDHLLLRRPTETDWLILRKLWLNEEVRKFLGGIVSDDSINEKISAIQTHWDKYQFGYWAVLEKTTNDITGFCGIQHSDDGIELSYMFFPQFWGKGRAKEAIRISLDYGFNVLKLNEIIAITQKANGSSCRLLSSIGMHHIKDFTRFNATQCLYQINFNEWPNC